MSQFKGTLNNSTAATITRSGSAKNGIRASLTSQTGVTVYSYLGMLDGEEVARVDIELHGRTIRSIFLQGDELTP